VTAVQTWIDEIRFKFDTEEEGADLHCYVLVRTNDHYHCPHNILGWKYKNVGVLTVTEAMKLIATNDPFHWETKHPPENQYGNEITAELRKAQNMIAHSFRIADKLQQQESPNEPA
jgi:hypothetical protein